MTGPGLKCRLGVSSKLRPKAQFALDMLLRPAGIPIEWIEESGSRSADLAYGAFASDAAHIVVRPDPSTEAFFNSRVRHSGVVQASMEWEREAWPLPFSGAVSVAGGEFQEAGDWIASTFFWLAGWDEWTRTERDRHGRVPFEGSLQERWGTIDRPLVDAYRERLVEVLRPVLPETGNSTRRDWALCPTHDLDYARKWSRGVIFGEAVRAVRGAWAEDRRERLGRAARAARSMVFEIDPYEQSFQDLVETESRLGVGATYFLKAGPPGPYDARNPVAGRVARKRIERLEERGFEIGLHPGYFASASADRYRRELERLEERLSHPVVSVRHHYLRWSVGRSPRLLDDLGLRVDSTLGYATREGFRRGTSHPFLLYDLESDAPTDVWEFPLLVMESTLKTYRGLSVEVATERTKVLLDACRRFGGAAVVLWHNIIHDEFDHAGWHRHFEDTLRFARTQGARVTGLAEEARLRRTHTRTLRYGREP